MKKILSVVAIFFASVLFLTGCGSENNVVCTMSKTQQAYGYDIVIDQEVVVGFEGDDKITDGHVDVAVKISDGLYDILKQQGDIDENMKELTNQLESSYKAEFGSAVKSASSSYSGQTVNIKVELDVSSAKVGTTKEDVKKSFTSTGFTCK